MRENELSVKNRFFCHKSILLLVASKVKVGPTEIVFKRTTPRQMAAAGR
jgi:hypothetical protein